MNEKSRQPGDTTTDQRQVYDKFESLPLDEKLASLFKMELATLSEAVNLVVKDPMKVAEKFGAFMADIGARVEKEFRSGIGNTAATGEEGAKHTGRKNRKPPASAPPPSP